VLTLLSVLPAVCFAAPAAEAPTSVHGYAAGWSMLGDYEPIRPTSLDDLPGPVRTRLVAHLKKKLGEPFYSSLRLCGGQIVDFAEFHRREPDWKDYQWEVFAYNLHFEFRVPEKGIEVYQCDIRLRADGSVVEDIGLPDIALHPELGTFAPFSSAVRVATDAGFDMPRCDSEMSYRSKEGRFIYSFRQIVSSFRSVVGGGRSYDVRTIEIDAHTGKIIRVFTHEDFSCL
jgi:hypothetical protein